ncbi:MAG TPA: short-chain dehydrogenase [Planctomycetaceae bacterium]|nr:short-chain dehydrogenase [Planctomycetaceae bacterium]
MKSYNGANLPRPIGSVKFDNQGRVVVVSGGSQGIGAAICQAFLDSGGYVACLDVREPAESIQSNRYHWLPCDTSSEQQCASAISQVVHRWAGVDVLVNNAAIQPPDSYVPLDQLEQAAWQQMIAVNLSGYTFLAKHAVKQMLLQGSGVIVNMSSGQGHRTARQVPCYGPIKAANLMQTKQWAIEYARHAIRVVSVSPGAIDTPLVRASVQSQGGHAALANRHPLGRIGRPDEIAQAVLWLSSSAASFVTATDLEVDGGLGGLGAFADPYPMPVD